MSLVSVHGSGLLSLRGVEDVGGGDVTEEGKAGGGRLVAQVDTGEYLGCDVENVLFWCDQKRMLG